MGKLVKQSEEEKMKKEEEESSEEESSEEESSEEESSDSSDSSNDSSSDSSEESSDSSDESESEEEKPKETKGKAKVEEVAPKGIKNKRAEEESSKGAQPDKKKTKQETNGNAANGHANGSANGHANGKSSIDSNEVDKWRQDNQITVVNLEGGSNPTAPYVQFADASYPDFVLKSIKDFNFTKPTPIQAQTWPLAAQNRDIIGIAETGSGKTLAFGYPAIVNIKSMKKPVTGPKVLVLAPTRELAQQIHDVMAKACVPANLSSCVVFGGVDKLTQINNIKKADVVTATPGRLIDLIQDGSAKLQNVKYLVFDEADRMLDMGFIPQIRQIVAEIPEDRQTLMFSATWPIDVQKFAHTYLKSPVQINIGKGGDKLAGAATVSQLVEVCQREQDRRPRIKKLLQQLCNGKDKRPKILIFMLYKKTCEGLYQELLRDKYSVDSLHGDKNQAGRDKAVTNFKSGACHILVATDVAARGLDIKDIKYVINGEMPLVMEDYIHRIGRTGRAGESGSAYTIVSPDDKVHARQLVRILEEGNHAVPPELAKIAETAPVTKPRRSTMEQLYGDFAKGKDMDMMKKATKITFD